VKRIIEIQRMRIEIQSKEGDCNVHSDDGVGGNHDFFLPVRHLSLLQSGEIRCEAVGSHRKTIQV
jgi:hypothetical protein